MTGFRFRPATSADIEPVAALWEAGWHDGHAAIAPPALVALRTSPTFRSRAAHEMPQTRLIEIAGRIAGFWMQRDAEIYQFYIAAAARGTGAAMAQMQDAVATLAASGARQGWLHCSVGNLRARAFYEKSGWHLAATEQAAVETQDGPFVVPLWRMERDLTAIG